MSADVLRQAAALMRERAEAAKGGTWESSLESGVLMDEWAIFSPDAGHDFAMCDHEESAAHIASWHPAVALAAADWLDATAARYEEILANFAEGSKAGAVTAAENVTAWEAAQTFVRAYLGTDV